MFPHTQSGEPVHVLCYLCRNLDLDPLLSRTPSHRKLVPLVFVGYPPSPTCALCRLFAFYCANDGMGSGTLTSASWIYTTRPDWQDPGHGLDSRLLGIVPETAGYSHHEWAFHRALFRMRGYLGEPVTGPSSWAQGPIGPRSLQPGAIDYSLLRAWLGFCQQKHRNKPDCQPLKVDSTWCFRLIDCKTRLVVETSSLGTVCPPFLALSYVWGGAMQSRHLDYSKPLGDLPLSIEDGITVTQKLGFRYLWVDQYCIRQHDEGDKHFQIRLMAEIYGSAQATIVAAAGSDPTYGLPGVSTTQRSPQPYVKLRGRTLTWTYGSTRDDISNSVWSTRGWTYQEGVLSSRRLVFTDKQVYFQCGLSSFSEAFNIPFERAGWASHDNMFPRFRTAPYSLEIGDRIYEYTQRKLGNENDILNAFQGIQGQLAKHKPPIHNIWGIPVLCKPREWSPSPKGFLAGLCWSLEKSNGRRHGFPSWSWAGWKGPAMLHPENDVVHPLMEPDIYVAFESPDGHRTEWPEVGLSHGTGGRGDQGHLRVLILECLSFLFENQIFESRDLKNLGLETTNIYMEDLSANTDGLGVSADPPGLIHSLHNNPNWTSQDFNQCPLVGVPITLQTVWQESPRFFVLVLQNKAGSELHERIGHFEWSDPRQLFDFGTFMRTVTTKRRVFRII
ncbi:heterokaryon incompatibility protein-domain-containing protein [Triangularia verruculosa]|uniref:Heterokaryon incompatibility protein-domain-containing protein n=1 Tax=Triangularia verruculosa TaxID=2587418 RepID=A0AAN6XPQ1_9PEZI|nr:heterokaryon incompatibility protein-domain-containing protein [Triangularia verruculosa]